MLKISEYVQGALADNLENLTSMFRQFLLIIV